MRSMRSVCLLGREQCIVCFFFFKDKTAYEMLGSLVGSEMGIRDRPYLLQFYGGAGFFEFGLPLLSLAKASLVGPAR